MALQPAENRRCWPISAAIFSVGLLLTGLCQGRAGRACAPGAPEGLGLDICEQDKLRHGVRGFFSPLTPALRRERGGQGGGHPPIFSGYLVQPLVAAAPATHARGPLWGSASVAAWRILGDDPCSTSYRFFMTFSVRSHKTTIDCVAVGVALDPHHRSLQGYRPM